MTALSYRVVGVLFFASVICRGFCSATTAVAQLREGFGASVSRAGILPEALAAQEQAAPDEDPPVPHKDAEAEAQGQAQARNHQPQGPFFFSFFFFIFS